MKVVIETPKGTGRSRVIAQINSEEDANQYAMNRARADGSFGKTKDGDYVTPSRRLEIHDKEDLKNTF